MHGGSLLLGFSLFKRHPRKSPNASRLNFATCLEVSQIWKWTSESWGTGFLLLVKRVAQKLVLRHRDLSANVFGMTCAFEKWKRLSNYDESHTSLKIWWLSKIITATQHSLTHICSEAYSKKRNLCRLIWTTKQRSLCRTQQRYWLLRQSSWLLKLPSSHCSPRSESTTPSPHRLTWTQSHWSLTQSRQIFSFAYVNSCIVRYSVQNCILTLHKTRVLCCCTVGLPE